MNVTAIVTMTRARSERESEAAVASLTALHALGLPVFAADANSIPAFHDALRGLPNFRRQPDGGSLVQQVKASVRGAAAEGHRFVMYSEPDKRDFFSHGAGAFLVEASSRDCPVWIAARDQASFATFPAGQQATERAVNQIAGVFLAPLPDLLYGPLILDLAAVMPYLDAIPDDLVWGWRLYVIARAARSSTVRSFVGHFPCPMDQRDEDDEATRLYRIEQARQCLQGLALGIRDANGAGRAYA
jgi:hypothetical protein